MLHAHGPISVDNEVAYNAEHVFVIPEIPAEVPRGDITLTDYPHLADLPISQLVEGTKADVLIGNDHPDLLVPHDVRRSVSRVGQPYATLTRLGWVLQGPVMESGNNPNRMLVHHVSLGEIDYSVQKLWEIEHENETTSSWSVEDKRVHDMWNNGTVYDDDRYTIPIPWRPGRPCFPDNRYLAVKRLDSTLKKLKMNGMYGMYEENVCKLLTDGHAELVPSASLSRDDNKVWYLPHHGVTTDSKPDKVRMVFDCAAKYGGMSLNSECFQGPDICNKLLHVLLRFRRYEYAITADVHAMYLQVRIPEVDRDCLRFLWQHSGTDDILEYRMTSQLCGGVWCATSSTYALRRTLDDFDANDSVRYAVSKAMYVDDLLTSLSTRDEAVSLVTDVNDTLMKGGFNLTKFIANDVTVMSQIPEDKRAKEAKVITNEIHSKALSIKWDVSKDQFNYVRKEVASTSVITKRSMHSAVSNMYDPLGLVLPVVIRGRMFFQQATKLTLEWDEPVPADLNEKWVTWWGDLINLPTVLFDRCIIPSEFTDGAMELHHFCDGSQLAYGSCSYIRIVNKSGSIHTQLLAAKARLTPLRAMIIPRVELSAAVLAVKADETIRKELELDMLPSTFWSDSQVVLSYIKCESHRLKVFVANRVALIQASTTADQWRYIPTDENPADILSRGCSPRVIPEIWATGPEFLSCHRHNWSFETTVSPVVNESDVEVKKVACVVQLDDGHVIDHPLDRLMDHYSDFYRLKKAVAWLLRWVHGFRPNQSMNGKRLTAIELTKAQTLLVNKSQEASYYNEIQCLSKGNPVNRSSDIISLDPMINNGQLVVGGRLKHAPLSDSNCHQVILSPHVLSRLILVEAHGQAHLGTEWVLSLVRMKYWIPGARNILRVIRMKCVTCQRLYGKPRVQKMADLPLERCTPGPLGFQHVGVDLFGPFYVVQGRSSIKRYGCVFTCFSIMAIHIEVLASLETDSFINGFCRFCTRRGRPRTIRSDNGTNLVGASVEIAR